MRVPSVESPLSARYPALPGDASWMALVADTSCGLSGLARWKVEIRQNVKSADAVRCLVVQSYRRRDVVAGRPTGFARPLASAQRSVDGRQLREGIVVDLVNFDSEDEDSVVLAWSEPGEADYEFDGLLARPGAKAELARTQPLDTERRF